MVPQIRFLASLLLVVGAAFPGARRDIDTADGRSFHLRVLATHDFHGALRPVAYPALNGRRLGGAAALKTLMDDLEGDCACPTVRLDGGDQMRGTLESDLTSGASSVAALNLLGLDAAAVGNHDLDWGVETLITRQREARYRWLAANVFRVDDGKRPAWATPFTMLERDGVKVGLVGYATVSTPRTLRPEVTKPYEFRPGYAAIRDAVDAVWKEHPAFVIIVAHAAGDCDADRCAGEAVELAAEIPDGRVQLIVGGHDHSPGEGVVKGVPIVRSGSNGRAIAIVDLHRRLDGTRRFATSTRTVDADRVPLDRAMVDLLAPYLRAADARGNERVTTLREPLSASSTGDRRLGGLIAEAARLAARADVGLHNPGGVRADLPRGDVSYADVYRVLPFANDVVRLTLTGRQLRELVERTGPRYYYSNLRVQYDATASRGRSVRAMRLSDGTQIRDDRSYTLATNDYLADGGDALTMLTALERKVLGITTVDAVVGHLRKRQPSQTLH
jgi:2',3'-cyclic-nucleotide 2'-phosphodiesterase / 3'-nucleotidase / 5'-nucleotidase